jgi:ATP-binding cassette, subfamily F, member 3
MTSVVAGRRRARKAGRDQTRAIDAGATSTAPQPVEFPPFNGDDVGALVLQCLTQHLPFDEEMAVVLSTYVSSVIDDAVGDPVETADAINTLLADSLADTSPEVLRDVKAFAKYLVNGMLDKHALQKQKADAAKLAQAHYERQDARTGVINFSDRSSTSNSFGNEIIDSVDDGEVGMRSKRGTARRARAQQKKMEASAKTNSISREDGDDLEDWGTAWKETQEGNGVWGGRGRGGRGTQLYSIHTMVEDVMLDGVTIIYDGETLLDQSRLQLVHGKCYGMIGANGCGKSTLLRRINAGKVPGWPLAVKTAYLEQEMAVASASTTALDHVTTVAQFLGRGDPKQVKEELLLARDKLMHANDEGEDDFSEETLASLCSIEEQLEMFGLDDGGESFLGKTKNQVKDLLCKIGFNDELMMCPVNQLSGGYRMRLGLACALVTKPDILLLDEPTNHMDLHGVLWLESFIQRSLAIGNEGAKLSTYGDEFSLGLKSIVVVSHDALFLDHVTTDTILFYKKRLQYFVGSYSEYKKARGEYELNKTRLIEAREKKQNEAKQYAAKQAQLAAKQKKGKKGHGVDPNKQRQAKEKMKKAERAGFYRDDGKRYKTRSTKDLFTVMFPQAVSKQDLIRGTRYKFKFPPAPWAELRLASKDASIIDFDDVQFQYEGAPSPVLTGITLQIKCTTRAAIVGPNGAGKTTLIQLICNTLHGTSSKSDNSGIECVRRAANIRIGIVSQHQIDVLGHLSSTSACTHMQGAFANLSEADARSHLGAFGLGGDLSLQPIDALSGGQKARLALAMVTFTRPHLLVLDEPTNHLDMDSLDALALGLNNYDGAVLVVSHNQTFLNGVCKELWSVDEGMVRIHHSVDGTKEEFEALLEQYVDSVQKLKSW